MSNPTAAQEEFQQLVSNNASDTYDKIHPEDRDSERREDAARVRDEDDEEEEQYRASQIDAAMRMPTYNQSGLPDRDYLLPPASFDSGRATGVKGVIADARNFEMARKSTFKDKVRRARRSVFGGLDAGHVRAKSESDSSVSDPDEEDFIRQWRESRRRELEEANQQEAVRTRRTSPSARMFRHFDEVDALGYLDAIEKVGRETVVVVLVYDHGCEVSATVESALRPLVHMHPAVHFVKVAYEDIEFDNAAVPAILAYRNQGDLFANLTGIIEMIPDDDDFDTDSLNKLFQKHNIL